MARSSGRWARLSRAEADRGAEDEGEGKGGEKTRDEQRPAPPDREAGFRRALGHREADRDEAREAAEGGGGGRHQEDEETDRVEERSEEHTSELQSLMRSSYAVFCLKKKTKKYRHDTYE